MHADNLRCCTVLGTHCKQISGSEELVSAHKLGFPEKQSKNLFCNLHIEQYMQFCLNLLTPRVKKWVVQNFLTFESMDRTLKCDRSMESC